MTGSLMHEGLEQAAAHFGARIFLRAGDSGWSFAAIELRAQAFARLLVSHGIGPGDRVVVMTSNRPEFVVVVNAIAKVGAAAVLVNPAWKRLEVRHALDLTRPAWAVTDGDGTVVMTAALGAGRVTDLEEVDVLSDGFDSGGDGPMPDAISMDEEAVLVFSSGTTGLPKAVRHTHRSIGWAIRHWIEALGLGSDDRLQIATPPSHILGLLNLLAATEAGASVRLHLRFDLDQLLWHIQAERMTLEMAVAPIAVAMANHPDLESHDLSSLRYIMWGATPVAPRVAEIVTERTGVRWLPAYGASELPVISCNPVLRPREWRLDSAGLAPTGVELRVVDLETGEVLASGSVGEIQARSPSVMLGYLPDGDTAAAFDDGWYRTGDVGWIEPTGWVHLTDRSKEMIKVNGFQVAPAELEAVLHAHPSVVDCAVFAVPDERAGEVPVAAVQLDPARPVDMRELQGLVSTSLATYKHLRHVVVVDAIPRLPSGKVLRRTLSEEWTPKLVALGREL
jgi:long-chain acyl-CoA synthetase